MPTRFPSATLFFRSTALSIIALTTLAATAEPVRYADVLAANPEVSVACSYTVVAESSEQPDEVREERFEANEDGGSWQLVSINGEPPSADALDDYADSREEREGRPNPAADFPLAELIQEQSVVLQSEDAQTIVFSFTPAEDSGPDPTRMTGTLVVDAATLRPRTITITNTETISPAATVKIQELLQEFEFLTEAETSALLLKSMHFAVKGRAMVFKKINEEVKLRFSDYNCEPSSDSLEGANG